MARYITTTLPYVNSDPHVGFAVELLQADALARIWRKQGEEVFFNTGTDEHGQKIFQKSQQAGQDVQEYVNHYASEFDRLKKVLNLSYDNFVRTTDKKHIVAAQEFWDLCKANGDIYKKKYSGLYCVGDEMFLRDSDLVDGKCPNHPNMDPVEIEEENYFFALSKYQEYLEEYLARSETVLPDWRRTEALNFVRSGLEDLSISREKARLSWGIPVPDDDGQVMYVWFDALVNYISALGWSADERGLFKKFWEDGYTLQVAGKDQIRFQSILWQAMLKSAGLSATDTVLYHGFVTSDGHKMSKSIGNVISPYELVEKYGTDATRYILLRHIHPTDDTDITWERMDEWYTANLVNGLGNLVARVMKLAEMHLEKPLKPEEKTTFNKEYTDALEGYRLNEMIDYIWSRIQNLDEKITKKEPFKVVKTNLEKGREIISECVFELYDISNLIYPFLPQTSDIIKNAVLENKKPDNIFPRLTDVKK
ncbi:Methionyl-tRNA synthetase [hydrothermal vent metagenome]|uniref:methionine--tRNA ligase n=1 Tax=hydrothermal vent metagenome TaxID=652676 RepID=A0A3B0VKQ8_9ZZZZ